MTSRTTHLWACGAPVARKQARRVREAARGNPPVETPAGRPGSTSLPGGDRQPLCVAVSPLPAQLLGDRGDDARAECPGHVRDDPGVVREIRADRRERAALSSGPGQATSGVWTRCSSKFRERATICGGLSTRMATCWTSWSPPAVTPRSPPGSFRKLLTGLRTVPPCPGSFSGGWSIG
jgi:hypothetical protein